MTKFKVFVWHQIQTYTKKNDTVNSEVIFKSSLLLLYIAHKETVEKVSTETMQNQAPSYIIICS